MVMLYSFDCAQRPRQTPIESSPLCWLTRVVRRLTILAVAWIAGQAGDASVSQGGP
jgi:hypothetical protein